MFTVFNFLPTFFLYLNTFNWYWSNFFKGVVMEAEASFSHITSPIFDGENYQLWAVKMEIYLEALDL